MIAGCRFQKLGSDAYAIAGPSHAAFHHIAGAQLAANLLYIDRLPLNVNDELRATTSRFLNRLSSVMMSSVRPSEKYSCSGSPDMFVKGSTAMEGLSVTALAVAATVD